MRKTITGTGGMLLIQTLKDAGVDYLFTNPGSAETGIFAPSPRTRTRSSSSASTKGSCGDGRRLHRVSGKVGVIIAHVMAARTSSPASCSTPRWPLVVLVIAGDWASEIQDYAASRPFRG